MQPESDLNPRNRRHVGGIHSLPPLCHLRDERIGPRVRRRQLEVLRRVRDQLPYAAGCVVETRTVH